MKRVLILMISLCALQLIKKIEARALMDSTLASQELDNTITTEAATEVNHIGNLVHPSEIRVPTFAEIQPYLEGAMEEQQKLQNSTDYYENPFEEQKFEEEEDVPNISYAELSKILALWYVENGKNFYDVSADTKAPSQ